MRLRLTAIAALAVTALFVLTASASAARVPTSTTIGGFTPSAGAETIAHWSSSFTFDGTTYPYTMVGTNPHAAPRQTTVATRILPLRFVFSDGSVLDGTDDVPATVASPIFQNATFTSGRTQYGDAIQRAEFWSSVKGTDYHAWLGQPLIRPTTTIHVPAEDGDVVTTADGTKFGRIKIGWFYYHVIVSLLHSQLIRPTVLPIYLSKNVVLYFGQNRDNCCVFGFHGAERNGLNTYAWASYMDPGFFPDRYGIRDVNGLSHEISEWYNDPFVNNIVPEWFTPTAPQYGCTNILESGDPLVGFFFRKNGYSLQDEAFYSWFARERPSQGIHGQYTYLDNFDSPAHGCS